MVYLIEKRIGAITTGGMGSSTRRASSTITASQIERKQSDLTADRYMCRVHTRHELGCWDSSSQGWKSSGFDMSKLPPGWHHLVAIGTAGRTFFYIALR